jgi:UDP-GlcNAc:undecaprenyl-phosphate GlcNAc-1-phosphate transferase
MLILLLTFIIALVASIAATFWARGVGHRVGMVDRPDGFRRLHADSVPRVGGVAVFLGAALALAAPPLFGIRSPEAMPPSLLPLGVAAVAIFLLGLVDDIRDLKATTKFLVELAVAVGLYALGLRLGSVSVGETLVFALPAWLDLILTVFWFVGIANAFNLIDGHDGVAGGVALLALATIGYAAVLNGNPAVAVPALALSGAVLGFLLFNLPPASVFLGDSGSLFLGFSFAGLGLIAVRGGSMDSVPVLVPTLALGLPVLDTSLAIFRRFLRGDPVFHPDRGHIHHRLHDMGFSRHTITLFMWGLAGIFSLVAVMLLTQDPLIIAVGLTLAATVSLIAVRWLETPEIMELGRAVQRAFVQRHTIAQNVRLRNAVRLLEEATSAEGLHEALDHAFRDSHSDHIELWIPSDWEGVLAHHAPFRKESFGVSWMAGREDASELWEISVKLELSTPQVGRLSLRYVDPGADALAHVDSIVRKLRPALCLALDRILAAGPEGSKRDTAGKASPPGVDRGSAKAP